MNSQSKEIEIVHKLNQLKIEQNKITEYDKKIEKLINKKTSKFKTWNAFTSSKVNKVENKLEDQEENEEEILLEDGISQTEEESSDEDEDNKYEPVKVSLIK